VVTASGEEHNQQQDAETPHAGHDVRHGGSSVDRFENFEFVPLSIVCRSPHNVMIASRGTVVQSFETGSDRIHRR
jgi:hypothetical protein